LLQLSERLAPREPELFVLGVAQPDAAELAYRGPVESARRQRVRERGQTFYRFGDA